MPFGQDLKAIIDENRDTRRQELQEPPTSCPIDGTLLDENDRGELNCPLGNYKWPQDGRLL